MMDYTHIWRCVIVVACRYSWVSCGIWDDTGLQMRGKFGTWRGITGIIDCTGHAVLPRAHMIIHYTHIWSYDHTLYPYMVIRPYHAPLIALVMLSLVMSKLTRHHLGAGMYTRGRVQSGEAKHGSGKWRIHRQCHMPGTNGGLPQPLYKICKPAHCATTIISQYRAEPCCSAHVSTQHHCQHDAHLQLPTTAQMLLLQLFQKPLL